MTVVGPGDSFLPKVPSVKASVPNLNTTISASNASEGISNGDTYKRVAPQGDGASKNPFGQISFEDVFAKQADRSVATRQQAAHTALEQFGEPASRTILRQVAEGPLSGLIAGAYGNGGIKKDEKRASADPNVKALRDMLGEVGPTRSAMASLLSEDAKVDPQAQFHFQLNTLNPFAAH